MKVKELMDRRSCCENILNAIVDAPNDHGIVELDQCVATGIGEFTKWVYQFLDDVIKNTEVFK